MKKAKILIPALAAIAFSTIASVTGTVAWFTSQSSASIETTYFTVSGLEGDLEIDLIGGVGTEKTTVSNVDYISMVDGTSLTHGSFDHKTGKVYTLDQFSSVNNPRYIYNGGHLGDGISANNFKEVATEDYKLYNAITWQVKFTYGDGSVWNFGDNEYNLYFDFRSTVSSASLQSGTLVDGVSNAARGFRIAMVNESELADASLNAFSASSTYEVGDKVVYNNKQYECIEAVTEAGEFAAAKWQEVTEHVSTVWSPLQGKQMSDKKGGTTGGNSCYVSSTTTTTEYSPTANGDLIFQNEGDGYLSGHAATEDKTLGYIEESEAGRGRADYLGNFNASNVGNITITFVAWYEGCDALNVKNAATDSLPAVKANMNFYLRRNPKAA